MLNRSLEFAIRMAKLNQGTVCKNRASGINPRYHLFGHIHAANGIVKLHQTTFVNAAMMNEMYEFVNEPILLEI